MDRMEMCPRAGDGWRFILDLLVLSLFRFLFRPMYIDNRNSTFPIDSASCTK